MSSATIFTQRTVPKIADLALDLTLDESHEYRAQITSFPVEGGSPLTDHIYNQPERITLTGFVTDAPVQSTESNVSRAAAAFKELMGLRDAREPVKVITGLAVYEDMAIESITFPQSKENGQSLRFNISLVKITRVSSRIMDVTNLKFIDSGAGAGTHDSGSTVNKGNQTTTERSGSLWYQLIHGSK